MKNKYIAGFLAILFGGLGLHKLYLGKPFQFILYILLLFISIIIPVIIGLIEGIIYLNMDKEKFQKKYYKEGFMKKISDRLGTQEKQRDFMVGLLFIIVVAMIYFLNKYLLGT